MELLPVNNVGMKQWNAGTTGTCHPRSNTQVCNGITMNKKRQTKLLHTDHTDSNKCRHRSLQLNIRQMAYFQGQPG